MPLNIDIQQILLHMLNFAVLFGALYFLLYKPVKKFMDNRNKYYEEIEEKTSKIVDEANELKAEYEKKMETADEEISALKSEAKAESVAEAIKIKAKAQKEAEQIISSAKAQAEISSENMVKSANNEICNLAEKATEKLVIESTSEAYDSFLNSVGENN